MSNLPSAMRSTSRPCSSSVLHTISNPDRDCLTHALGTIQPKSPDFAKALTTFPYFDHADKAIAQAGEGGFGRDVVTELQNRGCRKGHGVRCARKIHPDASNHSERIALYFRFQENTGNLASIREYVIRPFDGECDTGRKRLASLANRKASDEAVGNRVARDGEDCPATKSIRGLCGRDLPSVRV